MSTTEEKFSIDFHNEPLELSDLWPKRTSSEVPDGVAEVKARVATPRESLDDTTVNISYDTVAWDGGFKVVKAGAARGPQ